MSSTFNDKLEIRDLLENWVVGRDTGDWERLRAVWHDDGWMVATWFAGPVDDFIARSGAAWQRGAVAHHALGGSAIDVAGTRAIAQTKMTLASRTTVDGVLCDIVCTGRFYDFFERRSGRWGLVLRQPIYEKDRLDPVTPGEAIHLDPSLLDRFPVGYRHLAYAQTRAGTDVSRDLPGLRGPEVEALYALGKTWLAGGPLER